MGRKRAPCRMEGSVVMGAISRGALHSRVRTRSSRRGAVPRRSHTPPVGVSFFVTLQQDGSEGPKSLFSVSMTSVLRLLRVASV